MSGLGQSRQRRDVRTTSACPPKATELRTSRHVSNVPKPEVFSGLGHVPLAQWMSSPPTTAGARHARIKHLVTCRSQYHMHLLLFVPLPGFAHLPTHFAA